MPKHRVPGRSLRVCITFIIFPVQYCRLYSNPPHRLCYPCFQKGLTQGYVILKDGSRETIAPSKPPFAGKGSPQARAFEAVEWPEQGSPDMSGMLQDMFREWAKGKLDDMPPLLSKPSIVLQFC